jgi:hypothetical protein
MQDRFGIRGRGEQRERRDRNRNLAADRVDDQRSIMSMQAGNVDFWNVTAQ